MATILTHPTFELREEQMKTLIRNALMVAGQEMGEEGDHWPVVKNTITDVMRDWEELEIERAVHTELKKQMTHYLDDMMAILKTCKPAVQQEAEPYIRELRDIYDAAFNEPEEEVIDLAEEDKPIHIKRAEAMIDMLFDDSAMEEDYA